MVGSEEVVGFDTFGRLMMFVNLEINLARMCAKNRGRTGTVLQTKPPAISPVLMLVSLANRKILSRTYLHRPLSARLAITLFLFIIFALSTSIIMLAAHAKSPVIKAALMASFFFRDICRCQIFVIGSTKMEKSDTTLMADVATQRALTLMQCPTTVMSQFFSRG